MVGEEGGPVRENDGKQASASERDVSHARERDKPWLIRTYAGPSTAAASNALYRKNLARGQTGLSAAFGLPPPTGKDIDHPLATAHVGQAGGPVSHLSDQEQLFAGSPPPQH